MARLTNLDLVILEGTFDELDAPWQIFTLSQAIECCGRSVLPSAS